ncbi:hypothetical protein [Streptomyces tubercidicus]|uniref:hypothetical protein n=1 Tax=Streptomyces tubercidicus TaxID=47759 RepID=UPI003465E614
MAEWNLSVKLTGQGTDLVGTLRRSSTEARRLQRDIDNARQAITRLRQAARGNVRLGVTVDARSLRRDVQAAARGAGGQRITIPLGVDGSRLRQEVRRALTTAGSGSNITIPLNIDGAQLRSQIDRATAGADAGLNSLRDAAQDASRALRTLRGRSAAASHELGELRNQAVAAAAGLRSINTAATRADGRLEALTSRSRTFRTELDELDGSVQRVGGNLGGLRGSIGSVGSSSQSASGRMRDLLVIAGGLSTALVPIAASAVPIATTLGAAGAAAGAFGIAIAGQASALGDAADAQKKYDEAVRDHGATSKEAAQAQQALQSQLAAMPAPTRQASAALSSLKDQYQGWSDSLAGDTMPVAVHGFELLSAVIPRLTPMVKSASQQMDRLIHITAGGVESESFDRLFDAFNEFAAGSINKVTNSFVHLLQVLSGQAPADSEALREFMAYARANAPEVADTLKQVSSALLNLMIAASEVGVGMLQVVNVFAQLVTAIPPSVLSTMLQLYTAFKLVSVGAAALAAATGSAAVANLAAFVRAARFGGVGAAVTGVAQGMSGLQKAALGLGVLGVAAIGIDTLAEKARGAPPDVDRLATSLKNLAVTGRMTGELKDTFGSFNGLIDAMKNYKKEAKGAKEASEGNFGFHIPVLDDVAGWFADRTNDLVKGGKSLGALKGDFKGVDKALAQMASSGSAKQAAAGFDLIRQAGLKAGYSTKEINRLLPGYQKTVASLKVEQQLAAAGMGVFGQQAQATSAKLDAQKASADGLRQAIQALNDVNRAGLGGMIGFEAAIDAAAQAAQKNAGALTMTGGQLNLNSEKARNAASALSDLAAKTDEAAGAARESGASWESVNGIYSRGRAQLVASAQQMGLTKGQAEALAASILKIPDSKKTKIQMEREDAIAGLNAVQAKIKATPGSKSVTVKALTASAIQALESLGFKVTHMKDGRVTVSVPTGGPRASISAIQGAINSLRGKTVTNTVRTNYVAINQPVARGKNGVPLFSADGNVVDYYANGGVQRGGIRRFAGGAESHVAQFAPAGTWRVWAEPETGGEAYIPLAPSKRRRSRDIAEETVRRLGGKGIAWNADGSVMRFATGGFSYTPTGMRRSASAVQSSYSSSHQSITKDEYSKVLRSRANAVDSLRSAEARLNQVRRRKHTRAQLISAENSVAKARRSLATATEKARTAESRYKKQFSLSDWQRTLSSAVSANASWEANLRKIASRGAGADVIDQLRGMGEEGAAMVSALAKASNKQFKDIVANLRKLAPLAKATLADYTRQINASTKTSTTFQQNLAKIAAMGYGDLAMQLAGQGDEAAQKLAAEAAGSSSKAKAANASAKNAGRTLSSEELSQLVQIIAAVKSSKTGIHDVAASTGLGEDEIVTVATKASSQIKSSLGSRSTRFLSDLTKAQKGLAYENGGIRAGLYATQGGLVRFAEPSTHGEGYVPLAPSKRASATAVLGDIAGRFGLGLTPANSGQVVVIRELGPLVGTQTWHVTSGGNAVDTARQIESRSAYQLRRLARGGAAAR